MVCVSGDDCAPAIEAAFARAHARQPPLRAVHACLYPATTAAGTGYAPAAWLIDDWRAAARSTLSAVLEPLREKYPDVAVTEDVVLDSPSHALVAASAGAESVVPAAHRNTGRFGPNLGRVTHTVLHTTPRPRSSSFRSTRDPGYAGDLPPNEVRCGDDPVCRPTLLSVGGGPFARLAVDMNVRDIERSDRPAPSLLLAASGAPYRERQRGRSDLFWAVDAEGDLDGQRSRVRNDVADGPCRGWSAPASLYRFGDMTGLAGVELWGGDRPVAAGWFDHQRAGGVRSPDDADQQDIGGIGPADLGAQPHQVLARPDRSCRFGRGVSPLRADDSCPGVVGSGAPVPAWRSSERRFSSEPVRCGAVRGGRWAERALLTGPVGRSGGACRL
ncbi:hypothetical protein OG948_35175 (plasmid) [Embleya sp. NBC_00888]|uniref:universal stress protein n=1 Tax=Embleya sp. NBC_00888 TaxID=2975960 RepID=UPI002F91B4C1|nr:hypothetical protein OG948_35175 [Embleya sp. NBC_00888]